MKLITVIIQPQQLPAVKKELFDSQIKHITCTNIIGTATEGVDVLMFRGISNKVTLTHKVRIELVLRDEIKGIALEAIERASKKSGGFGIIFVSTVDEFINLGTGKRDNQALE